MSVSQILRLASPIPEGESHFYKEATYSARRRVLAALVMVVVSTIFVMIACHFAAISEEFCVGFCLGVVASCFREVSSDVGKLIEGREHPERHPLADDSQETARAKVVEILYENDALALPRYNQGVAFRRAFSSLICCQQTAGAR